MIKQGFAIGNFKWYVMCFYNIATEENLREVNEALRAQGVDINQREKATEILKKPNTGYTHTDMANHSTIICVAQFSEYPELFSTIAHEIRHATNHIAEYYNVPLDSEDAAYLEGEIARNVYKAIALIICPKCNHD